MTWIRTIDERDAEDDLKLAYGRIRTSRGRVSNIFKAQSLDPKSLTAHLDLYLGIMFGSGMLSRQQREMIAVVVSAQNRCGYCVAHHSAALARYVKDADFVSRLAEDPRRVPLGPKERAMVDYAIALTNDAHSTAPESIARLRELGMSDEEILNLAMVTAYFNFVNRLANGLGVDLEEEGQTHYMY